MTTVTIGVSRADDVKARLARAFAGEPQGAHVSFASVELLWRTMTPRRFELLQAMTGRPPTSLRALARQLGRDVKSVHGDAHALLDAGLISRTEDQKLHFPFDAVHVDFTIGEAA